MAHAGGSQYLQSGDQANPNKKKSRLQKAEHVLFLRGRLYSLETNNATEANPSTSSKQSKPTELSKCIQNDLDYIHTHLLQDERIPLRFFPNLKPKGWPPGLTTSEILLSREADAESILMKTFGPKKENVRKALIPDRFLHTSQCRGIDVNEYIDSQTLKQRKCVLGRSGFQGLSPLHHSSQEDEALGKVIKKLLDNDDYFQ